MEAVLVLALVCFVILAVAAFEEWRMNRKRNRHLSRYHQAYLQQEEDDDLFV